MSSSACRHCRRGRRLAGPALSIALLATVLGGCRTTLSEQLDVQSDPVLTGSAGIPATEVAVTEIAAPAPIVPQMKPQVATVTDAGPTPEASDLGDLESLTIAVSRSPASAEAHNALGVVLARRQQFDLAEQSFTTAIRLTPEWSEPYLNRGRTFETRQRPVRALADYERALKLDPANPDVRRAHARALRALNDKLQDSNYGFGVSG